MSIWTELGSAGFPPKDDQRASSIPCHYIFTILLDFTIYDLEHQHVEHRH